MKTRFSLLLLFISLLVGCQSKQKTSLSLLPETAFDSIIDGKQVALYTLQNKMGITMQVTNYGARVVSIWTPDKTGHWDDIVAGRPTIKGYVSGAGERFLGATIGRYANRIADGKFAISGKEYQLATYSDGQCLHGGVKGFDRVVWNVVSKTTNQICFDYLSKDMEEGFPGNLKVKMTYSITDDNAFKIEYTATTDEATPINLTHHTFFNLHGEGNGSINDHILYINADSYTPINKKQIPLGTFEKVANTPFDFRKPIAMGTRINQKDKQLEYCNGYDHNFVLNRTTSNDVELAATVEDPISGRYLNIYTTEPGIQFYSGNFSDGSVIGKNGKPHTFRSSFAMETQHFADSPNQPNFPSTILKPGETYHQICIYQFGVK
ncbi:MAG: aldose epimerase family protein [Bacteroidaceae bacterium]